MWDVIVIGAGIEGSATAYTLAKRGCKVLQLEQFALPHNRGSSHGQSRITRYAYPERHFTRMMVDAFKLWHQLETDVATRLYIPTGLLTIDDVTSRRLSHIEDALMSIGAKSERLAGNPLRERFPMMSFADTIGTILDPSGGILLADKCLVAYQKEFVKYGGVLHDNETVIRVVPINDDKAVVKTTKADYETRHVIITAGPWTSRLLGPLGLLLPLKPKRIIVWYWKRTDERSYGDIDHGSPVFIKAYGHDEVFGLPSLEYPGLVKVCYHSGDECDPDRKDDDVTNEYALKLVRTFIGEHLPGLDAKPSITDTCLYTMTPDEAPILDRHPQWRNIVIGAGFSGHGFKLAPVVGEILADLATRGAHTKHEMQHYRIDRFTPAGLNAKL